MIKRKLRHHSLPMIARVAIVVGALAVLIALYLAISQPPHIAPYSALQDQLARPSRTQNPNLAGPSKKEATVTNDTDLTDPQKKEIAMELVSSAENSSLNWRNQYGYIEDIHDGRGYTGGLVGFTSGTGDMLEVVRIYTQLKPNNLLRRYIPALQAVNTTDSHEGLGPDFTAAWKAAAGDPAFQMAQNRERDTIYFNPAVAQAKADGLHALGQFIYYDTIVMHGPGDDPLSFGGIRAAALARVSSPAQGNDETTYLNAFLDARVAAMHAEPTHAQTDRVDTEQRTFLKAGNLSLTLPLRWSVYGDPYIIR